MSTITFALTREQLDTGITQLPEKVSDLVRIVQDLALASCQYSLVDAKTASLNKLHTIMPTRWQVGLRDYVTTLAPFSWDNKESRFKMSHDKAWKALKLHGLLPEGTDPKGEVPQDLREKLLVFMTGALSAVSWANYKPKKEKATTTVTLADLQKQAAKLLGKASEMGAKAGDLFPDLAQEASAPAAGPQSNFAALLTDIDEVLEMVDEATRAQAIKAITMVIENAAKKIEVKQAA